MIADLKPYLEYKDSGLPWLGRVPCALVTATGLCCVSGEAGQEHRDAREDRVVA